MNEAEQIFQRLTLRQKVGLMICVRGYDYPDRIFQLLQEGCIGTLGSIVITQQGVRDLEGVVAAINRYIRAACLPLGLFMDAESGITDMFDFGTSFPTFMALGATDSARLAFQMGQVIAREARALGFTILCCPVLDINTNPDNPIVGTRALSDRPEPVIRLGGAYVQGMQEAGIIPNGKHFPGHGDTAVDSHIALPVVRHDRDRLMQIELKPFRELIQAGLQGIMTAHIVFPALLGRDEDGLPATLSRQIITGLLRREFGFDGLILSDSLAMKGIKDIYGLERSAVMAVQAGHDIILQDYATDPAITLDAVLAAVEAGMIDRSQIDASVRRILATLERMGTLTSQPIDPDKVRATVGTPANQAVAREIADRSVTLLEGANLPLSSLPGARILLVVTRSQEEGGIAKDMHSNITSKAADLLEQCRNYAGEVRLHLVSEDPDEAESKQVLALAAEYDQVIFATIVRVISYKSWSGSIPSTQADLINALNRQAPGTAFIILGNPYILNKLDRLHNCLVTYSDCPYSISAALKILFGYLKPQGRLPVAVSPRYPFGFSGKEN